MPLMRLSSVDLPEPLRPMMATISPAATCAVTPSSTRCTRAPSRKLRDRSRMLSTALQRARGRQCATQSAHELLSGARIKARRGAPVIGPGVLRAQGGGLIGIARHDVRVQGPLEIAEDRIVDPHGIRHAQQRIADASHVEQKLRALLRRETVEE